MKEYILAYVLPDETTVWRVYEEAQKFRLLFRSISVLIGVKLSLAAQGFGQEGYAQPPINIEDTLFGLQGANDVEIDEETAFLSFHSEEKGGILALDLRAQAVTPRLITQRLTFPFKPAGLSLLRADETSAYIAAVNLAGSRPTIELFQWQNGALSHLETVSAKELYETRDVTLTGPRSFYACNGLAAKTKLLRWVKKATGAGKGEIVYFDGTKANVLPHKPINNPRSLVFDAERNRLFVLSGNGNKLLRFEISTNGRINETRPSFNFNEEANRIMLDENGGVWAATQSRFAKFVNTNFAEGEGASWKAYRIDWDGKPVVYEWKGDGALKDGAFIGVSKSGRGLVAGQNQNHAYTFKVNQPWLLQSARP